MKTKIIRNSLIKNKALDKENLPISFSREESIPENSQYSSVQSRDTRRVTGE